MKDNAEQVIQQLLANKNLNLFRGNNTSFAYDRIPFGIPALDTLTGGGIPKKRMTRQEAQSAIDAIPLGLHWSLLKPTEILFR